MRGEDLLRDIEYINDDLIEEAMEDKNSTESNNTNYSTTKALSGGEFSSRSPALCASTPQNVCPSCGSFCWPQPCSAVSAGFSSVTRAALY